MADVAAPAPDNDPNAMAATPSPVGAEINTEVNTEVVAINAEPAAEIPADTAVTPAPATPAWPPQAAATEATAAPTTAEEPAADLTAQEPEAAPIPAAGTATPTVSAPVQPPVTTTAPTIATTIDVPAATGPAPVAAADGGEWELLLQKLSHWIRSGALLEQWQAIRTPLSLLAGLIALLLVVRVYGALLTVIDSLPLLPGLLELVGVIALTRFGLQRLVRSDDRQQVIQGLRDRWQAFRGKR